MTNLKKNLALILALIMCLTALSACTPVSEPMQIHESVTALKEKLEYINREEGAVKANLYFDNTQSMHGYICDGASFDSDFAIVCEDIIDVMKGYNDYTLNALKADEAKVLQWTEMSVGEFSSFRAKEFYTYTGSFAKSTDGPLSTLFKNENTPVNFDELNVFITDLAEQQLNNKELAIIINDIVLNKEDHSVALFCIDSMFSGTAYAPVSGSITDGAVDMKEVTYEGERPIYCLVVGPTMEVISMAETLEGNLEGSGFVKGENYNVATVLSKRGIQYSSIENAEFEVFENYCSDPSISEDSDYDQYPAIFGFENSNLNFNMQHANYDELFEVDTTYPGLCYNYNIEIGSLEKTTFGNGSINFTVPLSSLADGSAATDVEYSINADSIKVYGYCEKFYDVTDEYGDVVNEESKWEWEEIPHFDCFEKTGCYLQLPEMKFLANETVIERITDAETNENLEIEEFPKSKLPLYTVDNENGVLWINIRFDNITELEEKYNAITINFNIDGSRKLSENVPQWIKDYSLVEKDEVSDDEFISKTTGLQEFYSFLIGKMSSAQERKKFETFMTKNVTDVVVNVAFAE